jgi:DegV family protein with EDD domain
MSLIQIIADSCCDMSEELKSRLGILTIPFAMDLGEDKYRDDESLDLPKFKEAMSRWHGRIGSAAPSPHGFYEALKATGAKFCLTISGKLSASNENARLAAELLETDEVHIFDSLSASAGETLAAVKLRQLIDAKLSKLDIIARLEEFIKGMKTYFVLESVDNLLKNGRLNRITGTLTSLLHIKPLLGSDGHGQIKLFGQARGRKQIIEKLIATISHSGRKTSGENLVISHCDNLDLAEALAARARELHDFAEILIVPTGGLSSVYADKNGVILAY